MKRGCLFILTICLLQSCTEEAGKERDASVLTKPAFISLLVDLQIMEAHFHRLYIRPDLYAQSLDSSSAIIFTDHETSKDIFHVSLLYYSSYPDTMYAIYEIALDSVNQRISAKSGLPL